MTLHWHDPQVTFIMASSLVAYSMWNRLFNISGLMELCLWVCLKCFLIYFCSLFLIICFILLSLCISNTSVVLLVRTYKSGITPFGPHLCQFCMSLHLNMVNGCSFCYVLLDLRCIMIAEVMYYTCSPLAIQPDPWFVHQIWFGLLQGCSLLYNKWLSIPYVHAVDINVKANCN